MMMATIYSAFIGPASSSPFHYICVILRQKMEVREKKEMDSFIRVTRRKKEKIGSNKFKSYERIASKWNDSKFYIF